MITIKKINGNRQEYKNIKATYIEAFPNDERAPYYLLTRKARKDYVDFFSIYDDKEWAGFFYVVKKAKLAYVFYFAITLKKRGQGLGSSALKELIKLYDGYRLFLAIEEIDEKYSNYNERIKRKNFYENVGFKDLATKVREGYVRYDLYGVGGEVKPYEYRELMYMWAGPFLRKIFKLEV